MFIFFWKVMSWILLFHFLFQCHKIIFRETSYGIRCHFAKNIDVEVLKMCYRYAVIGFVCGSSTGTWSSGKCVIGILSTNLFLV